VIGGWWGGGGVGVGGGGGGSTPPPRNAIAESKPLQLATAAACGLAIPDTFITNDPEAARTFVTAQEGGAIYKPLRGSPDGTARKPVALYTSPEGCINS
jgi:hypothetical protein